MKNLEEYLEVYYDIAEFITLRDQYYDRNNDGKEEAIHKRYEEQGRGGMYELAKEWTDIFMRDYEDTEWGVEIEYYETMEAFLIEKNKEK